MCRRTMFKFLVYKINSTLAEHKILNKHVEINPVKVRSKYVCTINVCVAS